MGRPVCGPIVLNMRDLRVYHLGGGIGHRPWGQLGGCRRPHGLFSATRLERNGRSMHDVGVGVGGALAFLSAGAAGEGRADELQPLTSCTEWPVRGTAPLGTSTQGIIGLLSLRRLIPGACSVGTIDRPRR